MTSNPHVTILEHSHISPPPATVGNRSLPLTVFDSTFLLVPPVTDIFFYHFPHSKSDFTETIIPNLKHSLSLTLQHYFPFASNLTVFPKPDNSGVIKKPEIQYVEGDSLTLTVAESDLDFDDITGNHPRKCESFHPLLPPLGNPAKAADYVSIPVFSVQVTYFQDAGISIGMTNHHSLGDATTRFGFLKAWTSISRFGGDESFLSNGSLPVYERLIDIPKLHENNLNHTKLETFYQPPPLVSDKVRTTFVLTRENINQLMKQRVITQLPELEHVSAYTVSCGYIWSCIAKARVKTGEKMGEDELEQFITTIDCRSCLDPPIPATYLGNCAAPCIATIKNVVLSGENGFVIAAKLIGECINKMVKNKDGILKDADRWGDGFRIPARKIATTGTPKLLFYEIDFGWGKPKKIESGSPLISINACKESSQDLEFGLYLSSMEMEAFAKIFSDGLES